LVSYKLQYNHRCKSFNEFVAGFTDFSFIAQVFRYTEQIPDCKGDNLAEVAASKGVDGRRTWGVWGGEGGRQMAECGVRTGRMRRGKPPRQPFSGIWGVAPGNRLAPSPQLPTPTTLITGIIRPRYRVPRIAVAEFARIQLHEEQGQRRRMAPQPFPPSAFPLPPWTPSTSSASRSIASRWTRR
jgi:hypothetical protein